MTTVVLWCAIALQLLAQSPQNVTSTQGENTVQWVSAIILAATAVILAITAAFIAWQALETKRAAKAAAASVQAINRQAAIMERQTTALIASERAWIDGELIHTEQLGFHRYSLTITNHGKTPAQVRSFRINSGALQEGTKFSPSALANEKTQNLDAFLGAGEPKNLLDGIDMDEMFSGNANDADFATCGAYCVLITYADVIQRSEHETFFVYHYKPLVRSLSRISVENRYT